MLAAVEKKILEVGRDVVFFFAHVLKSRRIEHVHRHESLVWRRRFFDHHARKIFVQPAMPHLLGGAVEDHEARVRRQHAMHFLERRERVRHMMMHEGAGRTVEAARRERDRLGTRVVPRDRRRFLLRPREHRRRQLEPANRHARLMHRDRVISRARSDIEIAAVRARTQMMNQSRQQIRIGLPRRVVTNSNPVVQRHATSALRQRSARSRSPRAPRLNARLHDRARPASRPSRPGSCPWRRN